MKGTARMIEEDTIVPLVNAGVLVRPGVMVCCEGHATPVVVFTVIVGDMLFQMIVPVTL